MLSDGGDTSGRRSVLGDITMKTAIPFLGMALVLLASAGLAFGAAATGPATPKAPAGHAATAPKTPADAAAATAPAAEPGPESTASAADLKARLLADGLKPKPGAPLIALFKDYAAAVAREKLVPAEISEETWAWILGNKDLRDAILIGLYPAYDAAVLKRLQDLHAKFGDQVNAYSNLAVAFAIVYGRAGTGSMREPPVGFAAKGRDVPSMEDSFAWYLKNDKAMRSSLKTTPWPMLLYVADNDAPLEERDWALQHYAGALPQSFAKIYYDVPYDNDAIGGKGRLGEDPPTLANILRCGGVCMHRAYFASRVFKSMGIPSLFDAGEGGRGGHAWVGWVGREGTGVDLLFSGRFDYDKYYTGMTFSPLTRQLTLDRDVQLGVAAMLRSYPGWLDAMALSDVYQLFEREDRPKALPLLEAAIQRNAYCEAPWRLVADGAGSGLILAKQSERLYDTMVKAFATFPDLTFAVLAKILEPRLKTGAKPAESEIAKNLQILEKALQFYELSRRPDLSVKLRSLQGQYLEAVGRRDEALKLYVMASEKYVTEHYGFVDLFDRAAKMMEEDKKADMRMKYMRMVAEAVPEYATAWNRQYDLKNPVFIHVAKAFAAALRANNESFEADRWEDKTKKREPAKA